MICGVRQENVKIENLSFHHCTLKLVKKNVTIITNRVDSNIGGDRNGEYMSDRNLYKVSFFGGFAISYRGRRVNDEKNRSRKLWNLLEYIVVHRDRPISQKEMADFIWENSFSENPTGALKVLLHRVRKALEPLGSEYGDDLIKMKKSEYQWHPETEVVSDAETFEQILSEASDEEKPAEERIELYCKAFELYKGDFLPKNTASWVKPISDRYHTLYVRSVETCLELFRVSGRYADMIPVCRKAISIEPLNEDFYYSLIVAQFKSGRQREAVRTYGDVTDMFYKRFGINPSDEFRSLYRIISETTQEMEDDIYAIRESLDEKGSTEGVFFCEYEFFKNIYRLEARASARSGDSIFLCLLTLKDTTGAGASVKAIDRAMDVLSQSLSETLRRGDICSRYSISQFVLLLPLVGLENAEAVMKRVSTDFSRKYVKKDFEMVIKLLPLESMVTR